MAGKDWRSRRLEKRRFWQAHVKVWEKSGLSQNEYCRRNQLKNNRLTYWKKKFAKETVPSVNFVPVPVSVVERSKGGGDSGLTIFLGNIRIKLDSEFDSSALNRVMTALGARA